MARPKKHGPKKGNIPLSATADEARYIRERAMHLGFPNAARYMLALVEAERRLKLRVTLAFGERHFSIRAGNVPMSSIEDEIRRYLEYDDARLAGQHAALKKRVGEKLDDVSESL